MLCVLKLQPLVGKGKFGEFIAHAHRCIKHLYGQWGTCYLYFAFYRLSSRILSISRLRCHNLRFPHRGGNQTPLCIYRSHRGI